MKKNRLINFMKHKHNISKKNHKLSKIYDLALRIIFNMDFPSTVEFGEGLVLPHIGLGVVVHPRAVLGANCKIYQNVTIGCRNNEGPPQIGDNVLIGAGACILGNVKIGNNVSIGANSVVLNDVPDNVVVVGMPAKVVKIKQIVKGE